MNRIVLVPGEDEIIEKKSRFIGELVPVSSEEEAFAYLDAVRKKHYNASHHCFAYVLGEKNQTERASDDGEPSGTAGRPMLEVLLGDGLRNVCVVVTRYFGGVLLGTGGLVRAYTQAVKEGLSHCEIGVNRFGCELAVETDYNGIGKILYLLGQKGIEPTDSLYADSVKLTLLIPAEDEATYVREITEVTLGKAKIEKKRELYYIDRQH